MGDGTAPFFNARRRGGYCLSAVSFRRFSLWNRGARVSDSRFDLLIVGKRGLLFWNSPEPVRVRKKYLTGRLSQLSYFYFLSGCTSSGRGSIQMTESSFTLTQ